MPFFTDNFTQSTSFEETEGGEGRRGVRGQSVKKEKPITVHDLLTFAYQVTRGMEFLASRKVFSVFQKYFSQCFN